MADRGYELVSPADKGGYDVGGNIADPVVDLKVAPSGDRVSYISVQPIPGSQAGSLTGLAATRSASGWATSGLIGPPGDSQVGLGFPPADSVLLGTTPDQRTAVYWDNTTTPYGGLYIHRANGTRQLIAAATNQGFCGSAVGGGCAGQAWFSGISNDGRRVLFTSSNALVPGITSSGNDILYEWVDDGGAGTLHVVNRTNDPTLTLIDPGPAELGGPYQIGSNAATADLRSNFVGGLRHAISDDGSKIFFETPAPDGPLYVRENDATTVQISAPDPGSTPATQVRFIDAAADGSIVYFWANSQLTAAAGPAGGIYRYDFSDSSLHFVAAAVNDIGPVPPGLASDDGRSLLFGDGSTIYVAHDGQLRRVLDNAHVGTSGSGAIQDYGCRTANVTPDGRYFVFAASAGGGNIYRYDVDNHQLLTVSAPVGTTPSTISPASLGLACDDQKDYPRPGSTRAVSDDGQRVFFDTETALLPQDNNSRRDVYEWHDGTLSLISTGTGTGSFFAGTDAAGDNAFFVTRDPLVPQDGDNLNDIYDARVGGGFSVASAPDCHGDACQGALSQRPTPPAAGSSVVTGVGNATDDEGGGDSGGRRRAPAARVTASRARGTARLTGKLIVTIGLNRSGSVRTVATARDGRRIRRLGAVRTRFSRAGKKRVSLSVAGWARRKLRHGALRVSVRVTVDGAAAHRTLSFTLRRANGGRR
jgi:hypothetical protein